MQEPLISVVILNWNGRKLLEEFLPSVIAHTPAHQATVVVADNGSNDDSLSYLSNTYPQIKIIQLDKNYGFAGGYNRAIEQISTPYTLLLNSDIAVTSDWLTPLLSYMESHPKTAACQPKIRAYNKPAYFEYAGASGGFLDTFGIPYCRGRIFNSVEEDTHQYDSILSIDWATGAALFIRTDLYKTVGGLDEHFFAHQEEIDLCWRLRRMGHQIVVIPQSIVFHLGGATLSVENPRKTYLNFRNNRLMLYKNLRDKELNTVLAIRWWLDMAVLIKYIIDGHIENAKAIAKAHKDYRTMRCRYSRVSHNNPCTVSQKSKISILYMYYLRGKKRFSQL